MEMTIDVLTQILLKRMKTLENVSFQKVVIKREIHLVISRREYNQSDGIIVGKR